MLKRNNIKGLPEGRKYFTEYLYSDSHPWVEVKRTAKTITIVPVQVKMDPEWENKMDFHPGGFVGHMANQSEQTWLFDSIDEDGYKVVIRKNNRDQWVHKGRVYGEDVAVEFHDYNF